MNRWRLAALAFGLLVAAAAANLALCARAGLHFETSLLALLPGDAKRPLVSLAINQMAESASTRVILLYRNDDIELAGLASDAAAASLKGKPGIAHALSKVEGDFAGLARDFYFPWRYRLLSPAQRERLSKDSDKAILDKALESLYSPLGPPHLAPLESDPLGIFSEGLLDAASKSAFRFQNGRLTLIDDKDTWVVLLAELSSGSASMADQKALLAAFDEAGMAAKKAGASEELRAGFVFHAALAAKQAEKEMSLIGLGSTLGILFLIFLAFRSFKPLLLVLLPIAIGCLCALGLSLLLFKQLHVLTLVFGSSIIGVAVDYGVLYVAGCAGPLHWDAHRRRSEILRPVSMAIATSLLAYATLAALPFPILREMGVFTMLGLASAWLTAMLWLPLLAKTLPDASQSPVSQGLHWVRKHWPRVGRDRAFTAILAALTLLVGFGALRLKSNDDVRQLYASEPDTVRQQEKVQRLMRLPASGQFFLLTAPDEQALLQSIEALGAELDRAKISWQGVSQFVPSLETQASDQALQFKRIYAKGALASKLFTKLDSSEVTRIARSQALAKTPDLLVDSWLASPLSAPFRMLWLGKKDGAWASIVTVSVTADSNVDLAGFASRQAGVEYIDHLKNLGFLMGNFRIRISWLLVIGYAVVAIFLGLVYRREAWRILLPTLIASLLVAGCFGWLGLNYNLFCVFGILMSLDMGVDYGIFMQDSRSGEYQVALLSSSLAAISTLLSFGLLALSHTPALQIFGLSMLMGIGGSWLLAPCFRKEEDDGIVRR